MGRYNKRIIGGKTFHLLNVYPTKTEAKKHAEDARRAGFLARIRKDPVTHRQYQVWTSRR